MIILYLPVLGEKAVRCILETMMSGDLDGLSTDRPKLLSLLCPEHAML